MALTRLGWDVYTSSASSNLTDLKWITGKVRKGDAHVILDELCRRFDKEVEGIKRAWSWGYNYRAVRGAAMVSEHAAGTAIDLNAPRHVLGHSGTFSDRQVKAIRKILEDLDGAVRWGGDYAGRKDEMHFELQGGAKKLSAVAAKIKGGPKPAPAKPAPAKPSGGGKKYRDLKAGSTGPDVRAVQNALRNEGYTKQTVDGIYGPQTVANVRDYQRRARLVQDGHAGPITQKKLGL